MSEVSRNPEDWAPIIERIVFQVFYRQLGIVSVHCGISVAAQAIDMLCKKGYGSWKWLLQDRVLVWWDIPVNGAAKVHAYVFGGKIRDQNTVLVRQGFWRMYFLESSLRTFNETILGRILARIP
jgi:hypothetical protein